MQEEFLTFVAQIKKQLRLDMDSTSVRREASPQGVCWEAFWFTFRQLNLLNNRRAMKRRPARLTREQAGVRRLAYWRASATMCSMASMTSCG